MHAFTKHGLRSTSKRSFKSITRRKYPLRQRRFIHSSTAHSLNLFPWDRPSSDQGQDAKINDAVQPRNEASLLSNTEVTSGRPGQEASGANPSNPNGDNNGDKDRQHSIYGSGTKRSTRNRRPKEIPPIHIPLDFLENNVKRYNLDKPLTDGILSFTTWRDEFSERSAARDKDQTKDEPDSTHTSSSTDPKPHSDTGSAQTPVRYSLNENLMGEVVASISAGLALPSSQNAGSFPNQKSNLKLLCPIDGGSYFLETIVEKAAERLEADLIRIDAQDIAEMAGEYVRESSDSTSNSIWTLGYDSGQVYSARPPTSPVQGDESESLENDFDEGDREMSSFPKLHSVTAIPLSQTPTELQDTIRRFFSGGGTPFSATGMSGNGNRSNGQNSHYTSNGPKIGSPQFNDIKLSALFDTLLSANVHKTEYKQLDQKGGKESEIPQTGESSESTAKSTNQSMPKTVVILRGFKEMLNTLHGSRLLNKILEVVQKRRQDTEQKQQITLVGTSSSSMLMPEASYKGLNGLESEELDSAFRTLVITPSRKEEEIYRREERRRICEVNTRHVYSMLKRLDPSLLHDDKMDLRTFDDAFNKAMKETRHDIRLSHETLGFDQVHRLVFTALGQEKIMSQRYQSTAEVKAHAVASALALIEKSENAKQDWLSWATREHYPNNPANEAERSDSHSTEAQIKKLQKQCNKHEKSLLKGIINPENISTTFDDVHAPVDTIDALKTLTTLSLTRPEAFKYGVLAKDKLSGCLLYGPPGTGKTLLAKAVAKQSGATMLEVSGSDVYDMYVGEGEKNVRAVFSLAKKIAPCVVFVDEADAIFASRGSTKSRNSHRELVNQFLREWDGMTETSAFIMVATNRPFDLDDAALRRLPRRLLVDLPSEADRTAILQIHLKDEMLDDSVSLTKLAGQTTLYSGSDLKNLAVAAALAAVREENEEASKHNEETPYKFPDKRVLHVRHFDTAMEEISASINEDMSTLGAIRKFDERYGDRRGRKKKTSYGFAVDGEEKQDTAKVRQ